MVDIAPRFKNILANAALAAGSLFFVFLAGEVTLRAVQHRRDPNRGDLSRQLERARGTSPRRVGDVDLGGLVQPSPFPDIVYELKPSISGTFRGHPFQTNSYGLRDREYTLPKPPGAYRIVGLGDSVMFGWGVGQEDTYLEVLERRLNDLPGPHPAYEAINFAVPGYNTSIEASVFTRKALLFDPDLVIIGFIGNDLGVPVFMQRPKDPLALNRSYFLEFLAARLKSLRGADPGGLLEDNLRDLDGEERENVQSQYSHMVGVRAFHKAMRQIYRSTRDRGVRVVVILGSSMNLHQMVKNTARRLGFETLELKPYVAAYYREQGIPDNVQAYRKALWTTPTDPHPNAAGHRIFAEAIIDKMGRMGILSGEAPRTAATALPAGRGRRLQRRRRN